MKIFLYIVIIFVVYCIVANQRIKHTVYSSTSPNVIYSEKLLSTISKAVGHGTGGAKAAALLPPFVAFRQRNHTMNETWLRHEQTHHLQYTESFFLSAIRGRLEYTWARVILKKDHMGAYLRKATELEAYLNQDNPHYNLTRKPFNTLKYIGNKVDFTLVGYQVVINK